MNNIQSITVMSVYKKTELLIIFYYLLINRRTFNNTYKSCLIDLFIFDKPTATVKVTTIMNFSYTVIGGEIRGQKHLLPIFLTILT